MFEYATKQQAKRLFAEVEDIRHEIKGLRKLLTSVGIVEDSLFTPIIVKTPNAYDIMKKHIKEAIEPIQQKLDLHLKQNVYSSILVHILTPKAIGPHWRNDTQRERALRLECAGKRLELKKIGDRYLLEIKNIPDCYGIYFIENEVAANLSSEEYIKNQANAAYMRQLVSQGVLPWNNI